MTNDHPILVFGATGQVGSALLEILGDKAIGLSHEEADLSEPHKLLMSLDGITPCAIINAAAYTAVDKAEEEEELAVRVNADSPAILAGYAKQHQIPFIHYSTDYVFDGFNDNPWKEEDHPRPINAYGRSKREGEQAIEEIGGDYIILRTSWVYSYIGKNFVNTMARLGKEKTFLKIVQDQHGAPTYAPDLAFATIAILHQAMNMDSFPAGIYHLCNEGETNWHEFANTIFDQLKNEGEKLAIETVAPIDTTDYPTPAARPLNSRLNCTKVKETFGITMPDWQDALGRCIREII